MPKTTFEQSMKKLEQIVEELESGDLPLEDAMKKFEEGMKLSSLCSKKLDETEKKITLLLQDQKGTALEKPFESDS
jgi:exodeoxyribonuclease VII small subunit